MTIYSANYESAYSGNQPGRGTVLGDTFTANRPQLKVAGVAVPGFAALSSSWLPYDPSEDALAFAGVDTRLQMAKVIGRDGKAVCGFFKQLPLPATTGQSVELAIYGGVLLSEAVNIDSPADPLSTGIFAGLMIGDDLLADPDASDITMLGAVLQRGDVGTPPSTVTTLASAMQFAAFDSLPTELATIENAGARYVRFRLRQRCTAPATFTSELSCDFSESGAEWNCAAIVPSIARLRKSIGFGIWCQTGGSGALLLNFIDIISQSYDDLSSRIGGPLQFGAP
jgi:hypothetical protein